MHHLLALALAAQAGHAHHTRLYQQIGFQFTGTEIEWGFLSGLALFVVAVVRARFTRPKAS